MQTYPHAQPSIRFLSVRPEVCPWVSRFPTSSFLQICSHLQHPCLRLYPSHYRADLGLSPLRNVRRQAHMDFTVSHKWLAVFFIRREIHFDFPADYINYFFTFFSLHFFPDFLQKRQFLFPFEQRRLNASYSDHFSTDDTEPMPQAPPAASR